MHPPATGILLSSFYLLLQKQKEKEKANHDAEVEISAIKAGSSFLSPGRGQSQRQDFLCKVAVPGCGSSWVTAGTLAGSSWDPEFWVAHPSPTYILDLGSWRPAMESGDRWEV